MRHVKKILSVFLIPTSLWALVVLVFQADVVAGWSVPRRHYRPVQTMTTMGWKQPTTTSCGSTISTLPSSSDQENQPSSSILAKLQASAVAATGWSLSFPAMSTKTTRLVLGHVLGGLLGIPWVRGAIQTPAEGGGWYTRIALPSWTPPNRIFGPVWTCLYASMGYSLSLVLPHARLMTTQRSQWVALAWGIHYFGNLVWAPIFFGRQRLRLGLMLNYGLTASLLLWIGFVGHFCPKAALLLVPYLAWLVFATALNQAICRLNPTVKGYNEAMFQAELLKLRQQAARYADGK